MKYILEPLNEGHDMNVLVDYKGSKNGAREKAFSIASTLQSVLTGCSITCRFRTIAQFLADEPGLYVRPDSRDAFLFKNIRVNPRPSAGKKFSLCSLRSLW